MCQSEIFYTVSNFTLWQCYFSELTFKHFHHLAKTRAATRPILDADRSIYFFLFCFQKLRLILALCWTSYCSPLLSTVSSALFFPVYHDAGRHCLRAVNIKRFLPLRCVYWQCEEAIGSGGKAKGEIHKASHECRQSTRGCKTTHSRHVALRSSPEATRLLIFSAYSSILSFLESFLRHPQPNISYLNMLFYYSAVRVCLSIYL